ncbi:MAG: thermonuclease family protein [Candidatus Nealsonbacteria bacterium]
MKISVFLKKALITFLGIISFLIIVGIFMGGDNSSPEIKKQIAEVSKPLTESQQELRYSQEPPKSQTPELPPLEEPFLPKEEGQPTKKEETYLVIKVIDGDTIEIEKGYKVRYIGIDTPETVHPSKPVECFGIEASNKNKELVEGKKVRLEKDVSETDKYGRLLRYVYVNDVFVNDYLVRQGYAYASTYPPDVKYVEQFVQAQREARENDRGLWAACKEAEEGGETVCEDGYLDEYQCSSNWLMRKYQNIDCSIDWESYELCDYGCENNQCKQPICTVGWKCKDSNYKGYQSSDCSWSDLTYCDYGCENGECVIRETPSAEEIICSYNAYNCSDFSTHVEAQNVFEYCGGVSNDIHGLDGDNDGIACESLPSSSPASPPSEEIICSYNAYNCSDFSTHAEAQAVFEYCGGVTNDIHRLDADKDGLACESLP